MESIIKEKDNQETIITKEDFYSEEWLSPKDIEKKLKLSHATVSKLIHIPGFPSIRFGRSIRIKAKDLDEFLNTYKTHTINI